MADNPTYVKYIDARQNLCALIASLTLADFVARSNVIDLVGQPGSMITGGSATVVTAFDSGTTDVLSIGDAGSATRYLSSKDLKAAANTRTALTLTDFLYTDNSGPFLRFTRTPVGTAATAGEVRVFASFVTLGKTDFPMG